MGTGIFSDFQSGVGSYSSTIQTDANPVKPIASSLVHAEKDDVVEISKKEKVINVVKTVAPIAIPLIAIPVTAAITYKLANKNTILLKEEIKGLSQQVKTLEKQTLEKSQALAESIATEAKNTKKADAEIWKAILAVAGVGGSYKAGKMSSDEKKEVTNKIAERVHNIESNSTNALNSAQHAVSVSGGGLNKKYTADINGVVLMKNNSTLIRNAQKYKQAIEDIKSEAPRHLYETPKIKPISNPNPTLWSITSEFAPIKEGGLGSVPVELQNNITKLGVNIPSIIPMYQEEGISNYREEDGRKIYTYKGKEFELQKAASFQMDTYQNGKVKAQDIEVFVSTSKDADGNDKQLIFIKNNDYFDGTIYQPGAKTEEEEKFAVFSKAVYELMKAKEDKNSVKNLSINKEAFDSIKAPDALVLNDWQASPIAALARYKAPMENAHGQLSDDAKNKLQDINIITIGHNAMYQGSTRNNNDDIQRKQSTSNILNTLFDSYAYDIVSNARTEALRTNPYDEGLKNLDNVLLINKDDAWANHTNLLNMGICLSDYFCPVSQNYAQELISDEHPELAGELRWALTQKSKANGVVGIINGNDFNNLSIEAKHSVIQKQTGIDFETYSKKSDIKDVMAARTGNKVNFYNDFILPFSQKNDSSNQTDEVNAVRKLTANLEMVSEPGKTNLPVMSEEELIKTPIISSAGRLVSQKGVGIMSDAIDMLFKNWEKDFPNKPKPIFYLAGQDGENGTQRKIIEDLKNTKLSAEDSNRVLFAHGFAPMTAIQAASDFFLLPSIFEPCGLTQGEAFAVSTPVIGSAVGGIVDTVNRDGKQNGILTDKNKPLTAEGFYEAMKNGLKIYFDEPEKYQNMVKDSLAEDFSWIQPGKLGPVYDYLDIVGLNREQLPDVA